VELRQDGTLVLQHDTQIDGRGLDPERARRVLEYVQRMWRRPVQIRTVDAALQTFELSVPASGARRGASVTGFTA
jgi:stage V sporulation protein R